MIKVGKVVTTRGIKGEIKVFTYSNIHDLYEALDVVVINGNEYKIEHVKYVKKVVILKLEGVETPEEAKVILVGRDVFAKEDDMPHLEDDSYYVQDMIGIKVYDEKEGYIGTLKNIFFTPANDVYEIENDEGTTILIPAVKEFVASIDIENNRMDVVLIEGMI